MMRVLRKLVAHCGVTLQTGVIAIHLLGELIVATHTLVHGVTREARQFAPLMTGRFKQAIVLAPGDTHHPVSPVPISKEGRALLKRIFQPGLFFEPCWADNRGGLRQLLPRAVAEAILKMIVAVGNPLDTMTLTASLCGLLRREFGRIDDGLITLPG